VASDRPAYSSDSPKAIPLWIDQYPRPADLPIVSVLPGQVDVAIVGGGYTGLNAARVLAQSGAAVAVLERHTIGWGASSRNGGMATPGLKQSISVIYKRYGRALAHVFWQASLDAIDLLEEIIVTEGIDCHWRRDGHICVAYKESHFAALQKKAAWMKKEFGHETHLVPAAELHSEIGSDVFHGGLADAYSGGLHPAKYVFGLAKAVAGRGVCLCEQTDVSRIARQNKGFRLFTNQGELIADEVLVATNGYTDGLLPRLKSRIFPVGSYIIVTEPLPAELQQELSPKGRMFYDTKWFLNYFRLTPDGRLLWGGRNNLSINLDLAESARRLHRQMIHTFPRLEQVPITHTWTGQLGLTFDLMPHIGRIGGVHYALGYCGHGLSIATYLGTEAGLLLSGQKIGSPFMEIPHKTYFFYRDRPWFLPFAAWYYRFLDWVS
jgi:glycine/D-amino acid oxidase-like deaminating enzyme